MTLPRPETTLTGIDEAGRGPLLGPMFLAMVRFLNPEAMQSLELKDSKAFGSSKSACRQRGVLARQIMERSSFALIEVPPATIDRFVTAGPGLNVLEQQAATLLLHQMGPSEAVIADGKNLFSPLTREFPNLLALNKADAIYPSVGAASILAKHARDSWFDDFARRMEKLCGVSVQGKGYVNKKTDAFLEAFKELRGVFPKELRLSWRRRPTSLPLF